MLTIVGQKIIMQQGDDCCFKLMLIDTKGNEVPINENDSFVIRLRYRNKPLVALSKRSTTITTNERGVPSLHHVFKFNAQDTIGVAYGNYLYDVTLETEGVRHTVISDGTFILSESLEYTSDDVHIFDQARNTGVYLYPKPLLCTFNRVKIITPEEDEGESLIIF